MGFNSATGGKGGKGKRGEVDHAKGNVGGRGQGGSGRSSNGGGESSGVSGDPFSSPITFASKADSFVIAGDTFVPAQLYDPTKIIAGAIVRGVRVKSEAAGANRCRFRCIRIDGIDTPHPSSTGPANGRSSTRNDGKRPPAGTPFSEVVTFAGRSDNFVIAGRETFVPAQLYSAWRPVFEGDRLEGSRVVNAHGSSKYKAVSVRHVQRAEGPGLSPHEAWLERGQELLALLQEEAAADAGTSGNAAALAPAAAATTTTAVLAASDAEGEDRAVNSSAALREQAVALIDLAIFEVKALHRKPTPAGASSGGRGPTLPPQHPMRPPPGRAAPPAEEVPMASGNAEYLY